MLSPGLFPNLNIDTYPSLSFGGPLKLKEERVHVPLGAQLALVATKSVRGHFKSVDSQNVPKKRMART